MKKILSIIILLFVFFLSNKANSNVQLKSLVDLSSVQLGIIGSSYHYNNDMVRAIAVWDSCWSDMAKGTVPSLPQVDATGKIFSWNYSEVILKGGASLKFCQSLNRLPFWSGYLVEPARLFAITGNAKSEVDTTSNPSAFTVGTAGMEKKYNIILTVDRSTGVDVIKLEVNYFLMDYSVVKMGIVGSSFYYGNNLSSSHAAWDSCWSDKANAIFPSLPAVDVTGKIFKWNFIGVNMSDGLFKFSATYNILPAWSVWNSIEPSMVSTIKGNVRSELDAITSKNQFQILSGGLTKRYNLTLIIDQTTGVNAISLEINRYGRDYSAVKMGILGNGYFKDNISGVTGDWQLNWTNSVGTAGEVLPEKVGSTYTWSFSAVRLIENGLWKFREGNDWNGSIYNYSDLSMSGNAIGDLSQSADNIKVNTGGLNYKSYDIKLIVDNATGFDIVSMEANATVIDYSLVKMGIIGDAYYADNSSGSISNWAANWTASLGTTGEVLPVKSGDLYTWSFKGVKLINNRNLKFRQGSDWDNAIWGFHELDVSGPAHYHISEGTGDNLLVNTGGLDQSYNIDLVVDGKTGLKGMVISTVVPTTMAVGPCPAVNISNYQIFNNAAILVLSGASEEDLTMERLRSSLQAGVYVVRTKLTNGLSNCYKIVVL